MKRLVYLLQGDAKSVPQYFCLRDRPRADALFLTYDRPIDGAIYLPDSTWSQGRNRLLSEARSATESYEYYVFLDDDVVFRRGDWATFERRLFEQRPAVATPAVPKTANTTLAMRCKTGDYPLLSFQHFRVNDEQFMAFHRDVVEDGVVLPYVEEFDDLNWWCGPEIQEILIQNLYPRTAIQLNDVVVENDVHRPYNHDRPFRPVMHDWLAKQFSGSYHGIDFTPLTVDLRAEWTMLRHQPQRWRRVQRNRLDILWKRARYVRSNNHGVSPERVRRMFRPESVFYRRYFDGSRARVATTGQAA